MVLIRAVRREFRTCARRSDDTDARREARRCFGRSDRRALRRGEEYRLYQRVGWTFPSTIEVSERAVTSWAPSGVKIRAVTCEASVSKVRISFWSRRWNRRIAALFERSDDVLAAMIGVS
jgi:hypothetical protein